MFVSFPCFRCVRFVFVFVSFRYLVCLRASLLFVPCSFRCFAFVAFVSVRTVFVSCLVSFSFSFRVLFRARLSLSFSF